jgi:hypothetical protein
MLLFETQMEIAGLRFSDLPDNLLYSDRRR